MRSRGRWPSIAASTALRSTASTASTEPSPICSWIRPIAADRSCDAGGASVKPPQLGEFLMADDAVFRTADLAAVGLTEDALTR